MTLTDMLAAPHSLQAFSLKVQNKELIDQDQWVAGQTRFNGTQFTQLEDPDKSATVSFSISSNKVGRPQTQMFCGAKDALMRSPFLICKSRIAGPT